MLAGDGCAVRAAYAVRLTAELVDPPRECWQFRIWGFSPTVAVAGLVQAGRQQHVPALATEVDTDSLRLGVNGWRILAVREVQVPAADAAGVRPRPDVDSARQGFPGGEVAVQIDDDYARECPSCEADIGCRPPAPPVPND